MTASQLIEEILSRPDCFPNGTELATGEFLAALVRMTGATIVCEYGTFYGLTTLQLAEAVGNYGTVTTVDLNSKAEEFFSRYEHAHRLRVFHEDTKTFNHFHDLLDLLFIDTTHEFQQTFKELENAWRWLKPGAIIALHDVHSHPGVREALHWYESRGLVNSLTLHTPSKPPRPIENGLALAIKL